MWFLTGGNGHPLLMYFCLGQVGDPAGGGKDEFPVEGQLQDEHQLLGSRPDQDAIDIGVHQVLLAMESGDGFTQFHQALDGKIVLLGGGKAQRFDHGPGNREGGLAEAEVENLPALAPKLPALLLDCQGGGQPHPAHIHIQADLFAHKVSGLK